MPQNTLAEQLLKPTHRELRLCEVGYCHEQSTHKENKAGKRLCDYHFGEWSKTLNLIRVRKWELKNGKTKPPSQDECFERAKKYDSEGNFRLRDFYIELGRNTDASEKRNYLREYLHGTTT